VGEAAVALEQLLAETDANPIENADGRLLGADTLVTGLLWPLYDDTAWPFLNEIVAATLNGDASFAFESADGYNGRKPDGTYDNSTDAFIAINCADATPSDETVMSNLQEQIRVDAPILGAYLSGAVDGCTTWPVPSRGSLDPLRAEGAPDLLILGTTNDPATPYESAVSLSEQMASSHLVTLAGEGHTAYNRGVACIDDIVDSFFLDGTLPVEGVVCSA
jgi:hypothetical protein